MSPSVNSWMRLTAILLALLLLAACANDGPSREEASSTASASVRAIATAAPSASATPSASASPTPVAVPPGLTAATVTRIVDGDTIEVSIGGQKFKLRYIGMDTPETVDPGRPVGCFGKEASVRNQELVLGKTVGLEKDVSETDRYGRLVRYVWLDGRMIDTVLVEEGYARAYPYPPDVRYASLFAALQAQARQAGRGLWGPACQSPTPAPPASGCDFSGSSQPVIKGNISNSGEKIYHVPGGDFYDETVIDESKGERWFCTEADALAAGWRKSQR